MYYKKLWLMASAFFTINAFCYINPFIQFLSTSSAFDIQVSVHELKLRALEMINACKQAAMGGCLDENCSTDVWVFCPVFDEIQEMAHKLAFIYLFEPTGEGASKHLSALAFIINLYKQALALGRIVDEDGDQKRAEYVALMERFEKEVKEFDCGL